MKRSKLIVSLSALLLAVVLLVACATVPITGRKQLSLISDGEMQAMSFQQYEQVIAESRLSSDAEAIAMIKRVGGRIQAAVEDWFTMAPPPRSRIERKQARVHSRAPFMLTFMKRW